MTKQDLIDILSKRHEHRELSKSAASDIVESLFHQLSYGLKRKRRVTFAGFGMFMVRNRKARVGRNPITGAQIEIDEYKTVLFRPALKLKKKLNA